MWTLTPQPGFARRLKKLGKRNRDEVKAVLRNLDVYLGSLNQGVQPQQLFQHSFVHNEQAGVHAIDQSPLRKGARAMRLYVFPDIDTSTLHVITLGDKGTQSDDVNECAKFVRQLRSTSG